MSPPWPTRRAARRFAALLSAALLGDASGVAQADPAAAADDRPATIEVWSPARPNTLTPAERDAGWRLLFDGRSGDGWREADGEDFPGDGWSVEDGALVVREAGLLELRAGGDLFSRERFGDFVLDFEFTVARGGNSGLKYRAGVQRVLGYVHALGCEFQILDDARHPDADRGRPGTRRLGGLYDLVAPTGVVFRGVGAWNHGRIHLQEGRLSHYVNGIRVVDVQFGSAEWRTALAGSKFADRDGFCVESPGHLVLQDHGDLTRFRNVRIRSVDPPRGGS
ncbi:MAG: DUF1080 domain-containing protein [Myxococcota bacterium]